VQEQWQREYYLFNEVLHVRLFRVYRIWKAFRVWKNFVSSWKMRMYSESLEKNLFMLNGIFRTDSCSLAPRVLARATQ